MKLRPLANQIKKYEDELLPDYKELDNHAYLKNTNDNILWIHSVDDPMANYKHNAKEVLKMDNPNVHVLTVENKLHNPQYTKEAVDKMNAWIGEYNQLLQDNKFNSPEERKAYFSDKPIEEMTTQDPAIYDEIFKFLES